jgi:8-oxo-dGTP diphosphatase
VTSPESNAEEVVRAAGGLVLRDGAAGPEIVLVHRPAYDDWAFPKGKLDAGESEEEAAVREVEEETGLRCTLVRELGQSSYRDARGRPKTVRYWVMAPIAGVLSAANEVDDVRWFSLADATGKLTYDRDRDLLSRLAAPRVRRATRRPIPAYVVRHAKAESRQRWTEPDHLRPLTTVGRRQARALVDLFRDQPFSRLLSSPYIRCTETLEPLARARDLRLEVSDDLAEGTPAEVALELMLAVAHDGAAVFCTHGDVLIHALDQLLEAGVALGEPLAYKKGATWIFDVEDGSFARGRYLGPPVLPGND